MTEELSGIELRKAVAEALGWADIQGPDELRLFHSGQRPDGARQYLPAWEADLNAVFRDVVPFAKSLSVELRLASWPKGEWVGDFVLTDPRDYSEDDTVGHGEADNPTTAICRAFVALMKSLKVQEP